MKTEQTLKVARQKYQAELDQVRDLIHDVRVWARSSDIENHDQLLIAQTKEREDLQQQEKELDFKVRFVDWVLEDDKKKEIKNDDD